MALKTTWREQKNSDIMLVGWAYEAITKPPGIVNLAGPLVFHRPELVGRHRSTLFLSIMMPELGILGSMLYLFTRSSTSSMISVPIHTWSCFIVPVPSPAMIASSVTANPST